MYITILIISSEICILNPCMLHWRVQVACDYINSYSKLCMWLYVLYNNYWLLQTYDNDTCTVCTCVPIKWPIGVNIYASTITHVLNGTSIRQSRPHTYKQKLQITARIKTEITYQFHLKLYNDDYVIWIFTFSLHFVWEL